MREVEPGLFVVLHLIENAIQPDGAASEIRHPDSPEAKPKAKSAKLRLDDVLTEEAEVV